MAKAYLSGRGGLVMPLRRLFGMASRSEELSHAQFALRTGLQCKSERARGAQVSVHVGGCIGDSVLRAASQVHHMVYLGRCTEN